MDGVVGVALLVVLVLGIVAVVSASVNERLEQYLRSHYKLDQLYVSMYDRSFVGLNLQKGWVVLGNKSQGDRGYTFDQIVSVEVVQNDVTLTRTNRGSQLAGAAIGELALGPVGAIIGGLSGSSRSVSRVSGLYLHVIVSDATRPSYRVCFFRSSDNANTTIGLAGAQERLDRFHAHLVNAIRQAESSLETMPTDVPVRTSIGSSPISEIQALWDLKQKGALTDAEFETQKTRLLG